MRTLCRKPTRCYREPKVHTIGRLYRTVADELIEVTPKSIRLRKRLLDSSTRERAARDHAKQLRAAQQQQTNKGCK